jgi:aryl-alcohol dehydrogenase-like predicted oxidoreductase
VEYKQLGNTGVFVSRICLGTMTFSGVGTFFQTIGGLAQHDVNTLVENSLDAGVNFIDTANAYAAGESETMLGTALGQRRKDVVLASKVLGRMGPGPNQVGLFRLHIMQEIEASLLRLKTDYIDLYQIHSFDPVTPLEETLGALTDLVRQGKVRYIGCSNMLAWQVMKSLGISTPQPSRKVRHFAGLLLARRARTRTRNDSAVDRSKNGSSRMEPARRRVPHGQVHAPGRPCGRRPPQQVRTPARESGEGLRNRRCVGRGR